MPPNISVKASRRESGESVRRLVRAADPPPLADRERLGDHLKNMDFVYAHIECSPSRNAWENEEAVLDSVANAVEVLFAMLSQPSRAMASMYPAIKRPMMPKDALKDKVALVTGGGTGLGKAMTEMFMRSGASAFIMSRNGDKLKEAAQELREKTGGKILYQAADVRDQSSVAAAISACEKELGLPDVVVNNAAGNFISPTERLSPNAFKTIIDIVLLGTANVTLEVGKRLIAAKQPASFLAISATYVNHGSGFVAPSAAAKSGVETLYQSLASEWSRHGMRFNVIAPGAIPTKGAFSRLDPGGVFTEKVKEHGPPNWRVGEPEELANLATYVVSDYASWLNGEVIRIDGAMLNYLASEFNQLSKVDKDQWDEMEKMIRSVKGS